MIKITNDVCSDLILQPSLIEFKILNQILEYFRNAKFNTCLIMGNMLFLMQIKIKINSDVINTVNQYSFIRFDLSEIKRALITVIHFEWRLYTIILYDIFVYNKSLKNSISKTESIL